MLCIEIIRLSNIYVCRTLIISSGQLLYLSSIKLHLQVCRQSTKCLYLTTKKLHLHSLRCPTVTFIKVTNKLTRKNPGHRNLKIAINHEQTIEFSLTYNATYVDKSREPLHESRCTSPFIAPTTARDRYVDICVHYLYTPPRKGQRRKMISFMHYLHVRCAAKWQKNADSRAAKAAIYVGTPHDYVLLHQRKVPFVQDTRIDLARECLPI